MEVYKKRIKYVKSPGVLNVESFVNLTQKLSEEFVGFDF